MTKRFIAIIALVLLAVSGAWGQGVLAKYVSDLREDAKYAPTFAEELLEPASDVARQMLLAKTFDARINRSARDTLSEMDLQMAGVIPDSAGDALYEKQLAETEMMKSMRAFVDECERGCEQGTAERILLQAAIRVEAWAKRATALADEIEGSNRDQ